MPNQVLRTVLLGIFGILCTGITSIAQIVDHSSELAAPTRLIDSVYLISPTDPFDTTIGQLDEFVLRAADWLDAREVIVRRAKGKGANVAILRFYDGLVRTLLFYADEASLKQLAPVPGCSITIFRDSGPGQYDLSYAVTLNGTLFRFLDGQSFARAQLTDCPDSVEVKINKKKHMLRMHGRSRYFRLIKHEGVGGAAAPLPGGGIGVMVPVFKTRPNYELIEIVDEELGRLVSGSLKRRPPTKR